MTIMDYIRVGGAPSESTVIFNHLVDRRSIEAIVVCETQAEAKKLCTYIQDVPKNMLEVITADSYKFVPPREDQSSYRTYYINPTNKNRVIGTDKIHIEKEKKSELETVKDLLKKTGATISQLQETEKGNRARILESTRAMSVKQKQLHGHEVQLQQMLNDNNSFSSFEDLKMSWEKKKTEHKVIKESIEAAEKRKSELSKQVKERTSVLVTKKKTLLGLRASTDPIRAELSRLEGHVTSKRKDISQLNKNIANHQKVIDKIQKDLDGAQALGNKFREKAEQRTNGEELKPSLTVDQLDGKIKRLRQLKAQSPTEVARQQMTKVQQEIQIKRRLWDVQKPQLTRLTELHKEMESMNEIRRMQYQLVRKFLCTKVVRLFNLRSESFSQQYGNKVYVNIDHNERQLNFIFRNRGKLCKHLFHRL